MTSLRRGRVSRPSTILIPPRGRDGGLQASGEAMVPRTPFLARGSIERPSGVECTHFRSSTMILGSPSLDRFNPGTKVGLARGVIRRYMLPDRPLSSPLSTPFNPSEKRSLYPFLCSGVARPPEIQPLEFFRNEFFQVMKKKNLLYI